MCKKKNRIIEIHKYTVIEPLEEIYPETNRKIIRPNINIRRAILAFFLYILLIGVMGFAINHGIENISRSKCFFLSYGVRLFLIYLLLSFLCLFIKMKNIVIFAIRLYQRYGPYEIRCRCLFVPNCSEYMILAIEKYGLYRGIKKGIDRFKRCHAPNGGEDYP